MSFLSHRWFAKILKPQYLDKARKFFDRRGSKAIFIARFLAGLRMPTFFMAGTMGVSYWTFFFWDLLGALISCPVSIWLAYRYGKHAEAILRESHVYVFGVLGAVVLFLLIKWWMHSKKSKQSARADELSLNAEPASASRSVETEEKNERQPLLVPKVGAQAQK